MNCLLAAVTLLLSSLLIGCGGGGGHDAGDRPAPLPPRVAPGHWVVLGSSTAAGQGAGAGQGWAARLKAIAELRGVTLDNLALGGLTTWQAMPSGTLPPAERPAPLEAHNITRALAAGPRLVLLSFPTNDTAGGYSAGETVANLEALRAAAAAASAATLVLGVQPRDALSAAEQATLAEVDRRLATLAGACHVRLHDALADAQGRIATAYAAGDGIHLNDAGHAVVLARLEAALNSGRCVRWNAD